MPKTTIYADLACYGAPVASGNWEGVKLSDLLNQAGINPLATSVDFKAQDGYTVSIPMETALRPDVIVAYNLGGAPLSETLRLVVPNANGNIWISMITSITMSTVALSEGISGTPSLNSFERYQSSINTSTTQPTATQQPQMQPTPNSSPATVGPTVPPVNVTVPQTGQGVSGLVGSGFSLGNVLWVLVGVCVGVVVVGVWVFGRKSVRV